MTALEAKEKALAVGLKTKLSKEVLKTIKAAVANGHLFTTTELRIGSDDLSALRSRGYKVETGPYTTHISWEKA